MDQATRTNYDAARSISGKPFASACYAPWVSLLFDPRGFVRSCCQDWTHALGNVTQERLRDIWTGERIAAFRNSLRSYDLPSGCATCQWHIDRNDPKGAYARQYDDARVRSSEPEWPEAMEFMLSNACNLECVQCVGELSSSIRKHRDKLPPIAHVYDDRFMEDLRPFLHHLDHATFMGGEPFLSRENFRIWDMMIEEDTRFLSIVSTNGTVRNDRVERILDELPCMLVVSLDGASRETVESIRRNARFDEVMANIRHFRDRAEKSRSLANASQRALRGLGRGSRLKDVALDAARSMVTGIRGRMLFGLSFCLMPQNQHEFGDFLLLAEDLGCEAYVNSVFHPPRFTMNSLPREQLGKIVDEWVRRDAEIRPRLRLHLPVWEDQLARLKAQLEGDLPAPRGIFLAGIGKRTAGGPGEATSTQSATDARNEARIELLAWSKAQGVDEVTIDSNDIVASASTGFAGMDAEEVLGLSMTDILMRLRERYGAEVDVLEGQGALGTERTMTFTDLAGRQSRVRWIAIPDASGAATPGTTLIAARQEA